MELHINTATVLPSGLRGTVNYGTSTPSPTEIVSSVPSGAEDTVTLSQEGKEKAAQSELPIAQKSTADKDPGGLTQQQLEELQQLKGRDTEVRTHEQAHLSAAGQYARGGASFTYQKGPDGGSYAVGGEVGIDVAKESTPEATIAKMRTIKRAALAPANPSGADKRIASQANAKEAQARQELLQVQQEELLRVESTEHSLAEAQGVNRNHDPETSASTYSSLKKKLAAYEKMAAH